MEQAGCGRPGPQSCRSTAGEDQQGTPAARQLQTCVPTCGVPITFGDSLEDE